jgi:hypothetical protein
MKKIVSKIRKFPAASRRTALQPRRGVVARLLIVLLLGMTAATGAPSAAGAQGLDSNAGAGSQLFCKRDFGNFIVNGLDFDGEGFWDYWRDILVIYNTNYCQYMDIDSLLNRIDKARKQLRQAFYVCDDATVSRVTAEYYQLSAELYYLRHFVDTAETPNPKASEAEKAQKVASRSDIKAKFLQLFVTEKNYFDRQTGETEFLRISEKYAGKLESYRNCQDPNLAQLLERVESLGNTFETIEQLGKRFAERTKKRWSAMEKRVAENPGLITAFSADSTGDFFNRVIDFRVNNEPAGQATVWEQISQTAKENAPFSYTSEEMAAQPVNFNTVSADLDTITRRSSDDNLDLIYMAEYDLKYRQVQGLGLDKLTNNLTELKRIIMATFDPIDRLAVCTANIVGKQCGNK